ncbi:MAG: hypothetical protein QNJ57_00840 [Flavobacteriaceae bacterium]|nr:hypothetical protein [Flavobacteriaceae bacterium]
MKNNILFFLFCLGAINISFSQGQSFNLDYSKKSGSTLRYYFSQDASQNMPAFGAGGVVMSGRFNYKIVKSGNKLTHELGFVDLSSIIFDANRTMYYQPTDKLIDSYFKFSTNSHGGEKMFINDGTLPIIGRISPSTTTELRFFLPELPNKPVKVGDSWKVEENYSMKKDQRKDDVINVQESGEFTISEYIKDYKDPISNGNAWTYDVLKVTGKGTKTTKTKWGPNEVELKDYETFTGYYAPSEGIWVSFEVKAAGTAGNMGIMGYTNKYIYWPPSEK